MHACHFCSAPVENPREVYRSSTCSACGKDLKICLNCRFYSPGAHWDCSESIDEMVRDKDRANFCTFFSFRSSDGSPAGLKPGRKAEPGSKADSGRSADPGGKADPSQARKKLDKLFGNDS